MFDSMPPPDLPEQPVPFYVEEFLKKDAPLYEISNHSATIRFFKATPKEQFPPYHLLKCSSDDQYNIGKIVAKLGNRGWLWLAAHKSHLQKLGVKVSHVHPLKFLDTIFTDSYLILCMEKIMNDYFKRNGFMEGLGPSLDHRIESGELAHYLPSFAKEIEIPIETLKPYFDERRWEEMVHFLIKELKEK